MIKNEYWYFYKLEIVDLMKTNEIINKIKYRLSGVNDRFSYDEFLRYRMQFMDKKSRNNILTVSELWDYEKSFNQDEYRKIFNDKKCFYDYFSKFMKRDIMFVSRASFQEFREFIDSHELVLAKPANKYAGLGIFIIDSVKNMPEANGHFDDEGLYTSSFMDIEDAIKAWDKLKAADYILENYLWQHEAYASIHSFSLNTMRITTLVGKDGIPMVIAGSNQFGSKFSIIDNSDETSIWAHINLETGIVDAADIDEVTGEVYDIHPDTLENIVGFQNPDFEEVINLALELAVIVPECRLIGWDIARLENGSLELIEGNVTPELDLFQVMSGQGFRQLFLSQLSS